MTPIYPEQIIRTLQLEGLPTAKPTQDLQDVLSKKTTIETKLNEIRKEAKTIASKQ